MIATLDKSVPADIRAAVEGGLHGWVRLHRFQIAMAFPTIGTAATYLGANQTALVNQFQRLERDIGRSLFSRAVFGKEPQRPTRRGQALLRHLGHASVQALMHAAVGEPRRPMPDAATLAKAERTFATRRPPHYRIERFDDLGVQRIRISSVVLTLLRDLIDHDRGQFYGFEVQARTQINAGTLHPMIKRLLHAGWLTSWLEDEQSWLAGAPPGCGPGRRRIYYTLTTDGRQAALQELAAGGARGKRKSDETERAKNR
jgi:hypothetical protein